VIDRYLIPPLAWAYGAWFLACMIFGIPIKLRMPWPSPEVQEME
jgi:hypothetical protein